MSDVINVKVNQTIKGNKFYGKSSIRQRGKLRFVMPADVVINIRRRAKNSPIKREAPKQIPQATERNKSND